MMYYGDLQDLMTIFDDLREGLTERLEEGGCTAEEADLMSSLITNISECIDEIGFFITEAEE